ncbi:hypothetical protein [Collimonas pratensis]|uniref:Lipoprotein n=1 Tax=Collimonas pratensis TaxID=279113 RepID=A0ABN4M7L5_9BURK|nr:hypothetical protein [Collimonas pratensis]AMP13798.1 hypothetical protein CPter291_1525 [Collimonas pratensis]
MTQRFPLFLRCAPLTLIGLAALSAQAAGPLSAPTNAIPNAAANAATAGTSFNSLSAEDRKKLLATPESEQQPNAAGNGLNLKDDRHCNELQQQIRRAQTAAPATQPDFLPPGVARNDPNRSYQQNSAAVVQYDERSRLEARYHSECNK